MAEARAGRLAVADTGFAAEQFITMVLSGPRALRHEALGPYRAATGVKLRG